MDIDQVARRRVRIYYIVIGVMSVAIVVTAFLMGMSSGLLVPALILATMLLLVGGLTMLMVRVVRRRTGGSHASPLWGVDRRTRRRVVRAIRTGAELPPDEQALAVAEATRVRRIGLIAVWPFVFAAALNAFSATTRLIDGDTFPEVAISVAAMALFAFAGFYQYLYYRWAGAYRDSA